MPSQRYKLTIAYRGTHYHGWQIQPGKPVPGQPAGELLPFPTVQGCLKQALEAVVHHSVTLVGSSRTDARVHAKGQIAHFDTTRVQIPRESLRRAVNHRLPDDILVRAIEPVADTFDAIYSTSCKRYQYLIWNSTDRPLFTSDLSWHRWQNLDLAAIAKAAHAFLGEHDFASFARPGHGREHTIRTIFACDVTFRKPRLVIAVEGNGFLWNMVRIMVGTLVQVGIGRYQPEDIPRMLEARDRNAAGPTAPPHGLYLHWVKSDRITWRQRKLETGSVDEGGEDVVDRLASEAAKR
jgi:tRNA pseudouridine38-40 synthase